MGNPTEIARGLTKAQREALLRRDEQAIDDLAALEPRLFRQLHRAGLVYAMLSPEGIAVREALLASPTPEDHSHD